MQTERSSRALVAFSAVLWGTTGFAAALAPHGAGAAALGAARLGIGGFVLGLGALLLRLVRRRPHASAPAARSTSAPPCPRARLAQDDALRRHPRELAAAALALAVFQWSFFAAVERTGSADAALLSTALAPILSARLTHGSSRSAWLGYAAALAALLSMFSHATELTTTLGGGLAAALSALAYAGYVRITGELQRAANTGLTLTAAALLGASLSLLPAAWPQLGALTSLRGALVCGYLGLVTTALAYAAFVRGLARLDPTRALAVLAIQPLTAAGLGWLILDEVSDAAQWLALIALFSAGWFAPAAPIHPVPETPPWKTRHPSAR